MSLLAIRNITKNAKQILACIIASVLFMVLITTIDQIGKAIQNSSEASVDAGYGTYEFFIRDERETLLKIGQQLESEAQSSTYEEKQGSHVRVDSLDTVNQNIYMSGMDQNTIDMLMLEVKEGTSPIENNEICMEEWVLHQFGDNLKTGDTIKIKTTGGLEETFVLSGIYKDSLSKIFHGSAIATITLDKARQITQHNTEALYIGRNYQSYEEYELARESDMNILLQNYTPEQLQDKVNFNGGRMNSYENGGSFFIDTALMYIRVLISIFCMI